MFAIQDKVFRNFTHIETNEYVKDGFGFEMPISVIKQWLKKMAKNGIVAYIVNLRKTAQDGTMFYNHNTYIYQASNNHYQMQRHVRQG